ncbi:MAG: hypothetical protein QXM08_03035 [Thermofilaceae archaeon]
MLLSTHIVTALMVSLLVDEWLTRVLPHYEKLYHVRLFLILVSALLQLLIDAAGHRYVKIGKRIVPARNRLHSLHGVSLLSVLLGLPATLVAGSLHVVLVPLSAGLLHWCEDALTEGGAYVLSRRVRLPLRVSYDNPAVNRATILITTVAFIYLYQPSASLFALTMYTLSITLSVAAFLRI